MRTILALLTLTMILLFPKTLESASKSCKHTATEFRCVQYVRNYDGDTITFNIPGVHPLLGQEIGTRVYGIDTPEIKGDGPCEKEAAKEAKAVVTDLLKNSHHITIKNTQRDKYFRILGDVYGDDRSVADELIKRKLAYPYFGDTKEKRDWCKRD